MRLQLRAGGDPRGRQLLVQLAAVLVPLAMTLDADVGDSEPDASPSIPYHTFLENFESRIDHSPTGLSHREVFNAVRCDYSCPASVHALPDQPVVCAKLTVLLHVHYRVVGR